MKIITWLFFLIVFIIFIFPRNLTAYENITNCNNRYAILVNPVRARDLWIDKTVNPLKNQYSLVKQYNFPVTWLLQYDVLNDEELLKEVKNFNSFQELGVFLEVSEDYAREARVIYPHAVPWFNPGAVFLSGYSQSERRSLIDKLFTEFKAIFGFYPKSVGAWWIDSYSLQYMKDKYNIKTTMIVADQKTTDNYGVWGQWWGLPYYPSKANILTPASSLSNKQDIVVIQWAQRDPLLAFGEGTTFSNYSLQANDYTERGQDTSYFKKIVDVYLDCNNQFGQVTVGLETGMEGYKSFDEYQNQLQILYQIPNLQFVTMSQFAVDFKKLFPDYQKQASISLEESTFNLTSTLRSNQYFKEEINYNQAISFADYFVKDNAKFLNRQLPSKILQKDIIWFPWFLLISLGLLIISIKKSLVKVWFISSLFSLAAFGLPLRSFYQNGWQVYFGPSMPNLAFIQVLLILVSFVVILLIQSLRNKINLWLLPLVFGFDFILQLIRVSSISGKYYIGFGVDALRFIGISIKPAFTVNFINQDFPSFIAAAFLRINFDHLWNNIFLALGLYPFVHILTAIFLSWLLNRLPSRWQRLAIGLLITLFLLHLRSVFYADPRLVVPVLLQ